MRRWRVSRGLPGLLAGALAMAVLPQAGGAAPTACSSSGGVSTCYLADGSSAVEVQASSLDGGFIIIGVGRDGIFDLPFQSFKVYSFDDAEFIDAVLESATEDPVTRQIRVQFRESNSNAVRIVGALTLTENGNTTVLDETISVTNLVSAAVSGRLYAITDFDLDFDVLDDTITVTQSGTRIEQVDGGVTGILEVTGSAPTDWDVAPCCTLSQIATDSLFFELQGRNTVAGPADFQAAWSWDRVIGVGQTVSFGIRKTLVPEPGAGVAAGAAIASLAAVAGARRRSRPLRPDRVSGRGRGRSR
jgi:hypothetical protein